MSVGDINSPWLNLSRFTDMEAKTVDEPTEDGNSTPPPPPEVAEQLSIYTYHQGPSDQSESTPFLGPPYICLNPLFLLEKFKDDEETKKNINDEDINRIAQNSIKKSKSKSKN